MPAASASRFGTEYKLAAPAKSDAARGNFSPARARKEGRPCDPGGDGPSLTGGGPVAVIGGRNYWFRKLFAAEPIILPINSEIAADRASLADSFN